MALTKPFGGIMVRSVNESLPDLEFAFSENGRSIQCEFGGLFAKAVLIECGDDRASLSVSADGRLVVLAMTNNGDGFDDFARQLAYVMWGILADNKGGEDGAS